MQRMSLGCSACNLVVVIVHPSVSSAVRVRFPMLTASSLPSRFVFLCFVFSCFLSVRCVNRRVKTACFCFLQVFFFGLLHPFAVQWGVLCEKTV